MIDTWKNVSEMNCLFFSSSAWFAVKPGLNQISAIPRVKPSALWLICFISSGFITL